MHITNPPELPRIAENQRTLALLEHKVIVFPGAEICRLDPELAGHAEMDSDPVITREDEEHLLPAGFGAEEFLPNEATLERPDVAPTEDPFLAMELDCGDDLADAGVPLFAKIFDLGELRHGAEIRSVRASVLPLALVEKVIIIGSGCAGLTAAIYAARSNLSPLVLEGRQPGGQLSTTTLVENFPGFPEGIDGPQLVMNMHKQAENFGARFTYAEAIGLDLSGEHIRLQTDEEWIETESLIVASGASARWLGLENEEKLIGHGLTSCATCDGAFYRNVPVCVVGGGDSAAEEALFLTRFASKVYLIHRRDALRASKIMADRVLACDLIEPIWNTVVTKYITDEKGEMSSVMLRDIETKAERQLEVACVFVAIGHDPNTKAFAGKLETDPDGYLLVRHLAESKHPGVFIAGDVADRVYKQAITAAGSGCAAAMEAERYLSGLR